MKKAIAALMGLVMLACIGLAGAFLMMIQMLSGAAQAQALNTGCAPSLTVVGMTGLTGPVRLPMTAPFTVSSEYGMRSNPGQINHGQYRLHAGIDLAYNGPSTQVVAVKAGVVTSTPTTQGGGNQIFIDHGGGIQTRYVHLSSRAVAVGDQVAAGTVVGVEGSTGNSTGAHLHLEVVQNGAPIDPRGWFISQGIIVPALHATGPGSPALAGPAPQQGLGEVVEVAAATDPKVAGAKTKALVDPLPTQVGAYGRAQLANAAAIIGVGQEMGLDARTITIGVMTAIGESTLVNLDEGDTVGPDSRGLFQQRGNGAWGTYAQRMDPRTAATNFFTALIAVPGYESMEPTAAAHEVQGNADPLHYAPSWGPAVEIVSALTGDPSLLAGMPASGGISGCASAPGGLPAAGGGDGAAIVEAARAYLGTPYSWGGGGLAGPSTGTYTSASLNGTTTVGFDCSGLVMHAVYRATGLELPHSANAQGKDNRGQVVPRDYNAMQPGDVIAFAHPGQATSHHVGIYLGGGQMIHANKPGVPVQIVTLTGSTYWESMSWQVRRFT